MKIPTIPARFFLSIAVCILATVAIGRSQNPPTTPPPPATGVPTVKEKEKMKEKPPKPPSKNELPPNVEMGMGTTSERSIAVDPRVNLQLCAKSGSVKVNGWNRNEIRAFLKDGNSFGFRVLDKSDKSGNPILVALVGVRKLPNGTMLNLECVQADEIELDVPEEAYLALKAGQNEMSIDSIRKVGIVTDGGAISVSNVAQGVTAKTYTRGSITVLNSRGPMDLNASEGNIVTFGTGPNEPGDVFKANTSSGKVSIQNWSYRLADVGTVTGSLSFVGDLLSGGAFSFHTMNGAIRLAIPESTSCRVTATYTVGNFSSDLPVKVLTEDVHPGPMKTFTGMIGNGDCVLRLTTSTGALAIAKQPKP